MKKINEDLKEFGHSIDKALAGYINSKSIDDLQEEEIEQATDLLKKMSFEEYLAIASSLDLNDWKAVDAILKSYDVTKQQKESFLFPMEDSEYLDKDILERCGFTHYGIFDDASVFEAVKKYLDENSIKYLEDSNGQVQLKFKNRDEAYKVENAINKIVRRNRHVFEEIIDDDWYVVNAETKKVLTRGFSSINAARIKLKDLKSGVNASKSLLVMNGKQLKDKGIVLQEARRPYPWPKKKYSKYSKRRLPKLGKNMRRLQKRLGLFNSENASQEKQISEGVIGMTAIPSLNRLKELSGIKLETVEDLNLPVEYSDSDSKGAVEVPFDAGMEDGETDKAQDLTLDAIEQKPEDPMLDINSSINTIINNVPYLRMVDYKNAISNLEDMLDNIKNMGFEYLKERKEHESFSDFAKRKQYIKEK